ncbi:CAP domain-containing protein [Streptomyces sp. NPDC047097]|uniref:CAP domain-containing protein n=1 Tax=Streptomyces sp. NPDC047097 TaxID=3155260 RepID=UPI0033CBA386
MGRHRKKRAVVPVRTGLLGASAAMAVGAVAVASGLLPGGDIVTVGGPSGDSVQVEGSSSLDPQGGTSARAEDRSRQTTASRGADRSAPPTPSAKASTTTPSKTPSASPSKTSAKAVPSTKAPKAAKSAAPTAKPAAERKAPERKAAPERTATPSRSQAPAPEKTRERAPVRPTQAAPSTSDPAGSREQAAAAAVLKLVNAERAKAGLKPLTASAKLDSLAGAHSRDMAARGYFSHTDPDGRTPWDRAAAAGVSGLSAENIARGQADAEAVMASWMTSEGHRANILNPDYTTLGVGVHFGSGGPWWTQNFGF